MIANRVPEGIDWVMQELAADVRKAFEQYPDQVRENLMRLRQIVLDVAARTSGVGRIEEALRWGQISYLTPDTRSGTTIRIDAVPGEVDQVAMLVNCRTSLADQYRALFGDLFEFDGKRSIHIRMGEDASVEAVELCVEMALTYHSGKKRATRIVARSSD